MSVLTRALKWQIYRAYAISPPVTKYSPSWNIGAAADEVYTDINYGERWQAQQNYKLVKIEVPLSKRSAYDTPCASATVELYSAPTCEGSKGTLIGFATETLPTLAEFPSYTWVTFNFDPVSLVGGNIYGWLIIGCAAAFSSNRFRVMIANAPKDGISLHKLMWRAAISSMSCDPDRAQPFKIWRLG